MRKSYKICKHPNKIHIVQKYAIKINILKLSSNKKWVVLLTWSEESSIKFESEQRCWQTECWGDWICSGRLIYDKIRGVVVFVTEKNGGRRRNGGEWEDGRLSGHKLNITYGFIDEQI
jgi:hypothetical protein